MAEKLMWFGTLYDTLMPGSSSVNSYATMQWIPCSDTGMNGGAEGYSELLDFENGGADVVSAAGTHRVYEMDWNNRTGSGLDTIRSYQQKVFGPGLIYFSNPMNYTTNLFPPAFATPALIQQGWKSITASSATYSNTGVPQVPKRQAVFNLSAAPLNVVPTAPNSIAVIPIPPDRVLWTQFRGGSGSGAGGVTGVYIRPINADGSYAAIVSVQVNPNNQTNITVGTTQNSFSGATYKAVEVWIGNRTGTGSAGNLTLSQSIAQLWPVGITPQMNTYTHIPGAGDTGCKFTSAAIVEKYTMAARQIKGMSTELTEVGAWQRSGT